MYVPIVSHQIAYSLCYIPMKTHRIICPYQNIFVILHKISQTRINAKCTNMKNKKQIECYIKECLQIEIHLTKMPKAQASQLPMVLTGAFDLMVGEMYGMQVVFAKDKTAQYTPLQLRKVAGLICDKTGLHSVFVVEQLSSYNQSRLIKQGVNFILPGKLMFMPELLIDIRPIRNRFNQDSKMPTTAQLVVLYHLERQPIILATIADIAEKMGVSYATCNKALTWLRGHKLATETKVGKQKLISIDKDKRAVWEKALPFMYSPVERILYTDVEVSYQSGYNALAAYSHLAHTEGDVRAWYGPVPTYFTKEENRIKIEVWRYNPELLSHTNVVDPLSLYITLKDDEDERVSMELDYMLHQVLDNEWTD